MALIYSIPPTSNTEWTKHAEMLWQREQECDSHTVCPSDLDRHYSSKEKPIKKNSNWSRMLIQYFQIQ